MIYDIEILPNVFIIVFFNGTDYYTFEISKRKDDRYELIIFLRSLDLMIGFRNVLYDYPILHYLIKLINRNITGKDLTYHLYLKSKQIIKSKNQWSNAVRKPYIPQLDLFLINHFDNFSKITSLKILEFNMRMDNIKEMIIDWDVPIEENKINEIIDYCKNDVLTTFYFFGFNSDQISFRKKRSKIYNHNFTNYNDVKIGEWVLLNAVAKEMNRDIYEIKQLRTPRDRMEMSDIIYPFINFKTIEGQTLLKWWKNKTIYNTKGQFSELPLDQVQELLPYCNPKLKNKKLKNLNIIIDGFQFDFGTGGIHGALRSGIWTEDKDNEIILIDVSSYYPMSAYNFKLHPEHIPVNIFMNVIISLYNQRMKARDEGDFETVKANKLALNGALYGKSNSPFSFMYDPQFMMKICVNNQLLMVMIAEQVLLHNFELIQINTDGLYIRLPRNKRKILDNIVNQWMKFTNLKLEYDFFSKIIQKDVNNYLAVYTNGKIKYKGLFDFNYTENGDWHKNFSALIIPKAIKAYYIDNIPIETTLRNGDIYDFFLRTKFDKTSKLFQRKYEEVDLLSKRKPIIIFEQQLQNVTRYYVANNGYKFVKTMKPLQGKEDKGDREFAVEKGYLCREANQLTKDILPSIRQNINYQYYINKINDIINSIPI